MPGNAEKVDFAAYANSKSFWSDALCSVSLRPGDVLLGHAQKWKNALSTQCVLRTFVRCTGAIAAVFRFRQTRSTAFVPTLLLQSTCLLHPCV